MPVYTIDTVIAECVRTYDVRGHAPGAKEEIYYSSWKALNQWIETKLAKQLVGIIFFFELSIFSPLHIPLML